MDRRIAWTIEEMKRRIAEPLRVADLAVAVRLSPSRYAHLFRHQAGCAPAQYFRTLRMNHAEALLERTFLTVKEVMASVGYSDPSHFARDFRRCHGMTPRAWRTVRGAIVVSDDDARYQSATVAPTAAYAGGRQDSAANSGSDRRRVAAIVNSVRTDNGDDEP